MRIPLHYYRILSVPVKASEEQLLQAYSDRLMQKPRREYNQQAIKARQELIEQAYRVLSDPEARAEYDVQFLTQMQPVTTVVPEGEAATTEEKPVAESAIADDPVVNPTIEISQSQIVGALLIFHELGEYELVLSLGIDYYNSEAFSKFQQQQKPEVNIAIQENIILALALAYLELAREHWHRQKCVMAARFSQLGIDLLKQEKLFPQVQQELELDLYKLRPYQILELISQNPPNSAPRAKGIELLQKMLKQRQGIEGKGEDNSGLDFEDFLGFIQQLRNYLTSQEQQQLFDNDPNNSAIALYLAVYALLARGFCKKQPELVLEAQHKLERLSDKQNVAWEQAVCFLLLGDTEKAIEKVYQTKDSNKLEQILQHSSVSADLLPGICFYSEQWLHQEVVSDFVDLVNIKLTLKEYFADRQVQAYINKLIAPTVQPTPATTEVLTPVTKPTSSKNTQVKVMSFRSLLRNLFATEKSSDNKVAANQITPKETVLVGAGVATNAGSIKGDRSVRISAKPNQPKSSTVRAKQKPKGNPKAKQNSVPQDTPAVPPAVIQQAQGKQKKVRRKKNPTVVLKGWLFIFSWVFGSVTLAFLATRLFLNPNQQTAKNAELAIAISDPTVEIPPVKAKPVVAKPKPTFTQQSRQTIEKWLSSKSAAFGKEHQVQQLDSILAEPLLTTWRDHATAYQQDNIHREYQHQIEMRSAKVNPNNPNQATVEARVKEVAQHYQSGQLDDALSYDDNLLVRYQLVRQGNKWLIENTKVLETL